jgi:hypothetical protein
MFDITYQPNGCFLRCASFISWLENTVQLTPANKDNQNLHNPEYFVKLQTEACYQDRSAGFQPTILGNIHTNFQQVVCFSFYFF